MAKHERPGKMRQMSEPVRLALQIVLLIVLGAIFWTLGALYLFERVGFFPVGVAFAILATCVSLWLDDPAGIGSNDESGGGGPWSSDDDGGDGGE